MARYTIELKDVVRNHNIFDFKYPFYDERKRPEFEEQFIRHFYFREIGAETIDRFKVYLEDKMLTVFPYYNKLFEAASIEYDLLNNYNLTEEFTTTREHEGKTAGVSSTVGQLHGEQITESHGNRVTDTTGNVDTLGKDTETGTEKTTTESHGTTETDTTGKTTTDGSADRSTDETINGNKKNVQKFLDTPQGLTDLSNTKYLTNLTENTEDSEQERNVEETSSNEQTTDTTGNSSTVTDNNGESNTARNSEKNTLVNQETTGKETTVDDVNGTVKDEQKTTQDNNTRTYMDSRQTETHKLTRIGNIGVQTGADMVRIHIELQKTLRNIERMFFDECEDLFMLAF